MDDAELYKRVGDAVSARRRELRLKQAELAAAIGMSRASVANIEVGRQKVMLHQMCRLASALRVNSIADLLPTTIEQSKEPVVELPREGLTAHQRRQVEEILNSTDTVRRRRTTRK